MLRLLALSPLISAALLAGALPSTPAAPAPVASPAPPPAADAPAPYCVGEYAESLASLSTRARGYEERGAAYTFCVRTSANYDCPSYGADGTIHSARRHAVAHGTGFAFEQKDGSTLLLTNDHVAEWPAITDVDHPVDDVPAGCKRVSSALSIVDNESDDYDRDDIPLSTVAADPQLDVAILSAKATLPILPWKVGRSASLELRDAVDVRGFPLGLFKATTLGSVISTYDHDTYKDWDHDDFVIDAPLSAGNSGSPVLAVSCKTGEFELVGIFHAAYSSGSALNVVIGIDQVRDLMTTLKRTPRSRGDGIVLDAAARSRLIAQASASRDPYFPFGAQIAAVRARPDGLLFFELFGDGFPYANEPILVLEDLPPAANDRFGTAGGAWAGNARGLKAIERGALPVDQQAQLSHLLDAVRHDAVATFAWRAERPDAPLSRDRFQHASQLERSLRKASTDHVDQVKAALELVDGLGPERGEASVALAELLTPPPPPPPAPPSPLPPALSPPLAPGGVQPAPASSAAPDPKSCAPGGCKAATPR